MPCTSGAFFLPARNYNSMRVITDELHAALVKLLASDEKVQLFQQLILSQKLEPNEVADNGLQQSNTES